MASDAEKNLRHLEADTGESLLVSARVSLAENANLSARTEETPSGTSTPSSDANGDAHPSGSYGNPTSSSATESVAPSSAPEEIIGATEGVLEMSFLATTIPSTTTIGRRHPLPSPSTTESSVKNEVTYNDNITGPVYDFKANISLTTPMSTRPTSTPTQSLNEHTELGETNTTASTHLSHSPVSTQSEISSTTNIFTETETPDSTIAPGQNGTTASLATGARAAIGERGRNDTAASQETVDSEVSSSAGSDWMENATVVPPSEATSFTLFTTVEQSHAAEHYIESMSSTIEDGVSFTEPSNSTTSTDYSYTSVEVTTNSIGNYSSVDSSDGMDVTTAIPEFRTSSINSVMEETNTTLSVLEISVSPVRSSNIQPENEGETTKTPQATRTDATEANESNIKNDEITNQTATVQPSTTTNEATVSEELTIVSVATTKEAVESPIKMASSPTTIQSNGFDDKEKKPNTPHMDEGDNANDAEVMIRAYPAYVRLWMKISWDEICREQLQMSLKESVAQFLSTATHRNVPISRVILLNFDESCMESTQDDAKSLSPVYFCILALADKEQNERRRASNQNSDDEEKVLVHCDSMLTELFPHLWTQTPRPTVEPLIHIKEVNLVRSKWGSEDGLEYPSNLADDNTSVFAAIGISSVAAVCLLLIGALLIIMRRRQRRFNYGQRCTPVSLDAYSLDSVSVRDGSRRGRVQTRNGEAGRGVNGLRKVDGVTDWRASKRSYGNPAFEDDDGEEVLLSKPLNFAALANAAINEEGSLADEFALIPKRFYKRSLRRKSRSKYKDPGAAERGEAGVSAKDANEEDEGLPEGAEEKNRYANVIPLTSTRVRLSPKQSGPLSTYINANYVRGPKNEEKFYIACQAPLSTTIEDFWRMMWEQQSKVILMLTSLVENGVEKCADYLPPSEVLDCHRLFGDYQVTLKKREVREKYIVSSLQLKDMESNLWREVTHLWFLGWPITGVPEEPSQIIAFLIEARPFIQANTGPTVVHCSPGTGRTGTVITIDVCIRDFEQSRMVDVPKVVQQLRRDRDGAVQTQQQYVFIYQALSLYATKLTGGAMDSF